MRRKSPILICGLLLVLWIGSARAGDVIDRIVATVNGHIILQSDWDDALAYESFVNGKPLPQFTGAERKAVLDRLLDQELLLQQISPNDPQFEPDAQTISARLQDVRKQSQGRETDQGWHDLLTSYGLTEEELKHHLATQIIILRLIDEHLASTVQVDDKSIEDYYNQTFLPELRRKGAKEPPLAEVSAKISELLRQQKLNDALKEWLQNLHDGSVIRLTDAPPNGGSPR